MSTEVCIVGASRTPIGGFGGSLSSLSATKLGSIALESALQRAGVNGNVVGEVYMGHVLAAGCGQASARQACLGAGIPETVPCTAVNKVCASGMKAVALGAMAIMTKQHEVVVAGGMESMSNVPYYVPKMRWGNRMGNTEMVDGMIKDGLWDVSNDFHMGVAAELCATMHQIPREDQDTHAATSYTRAAEASKNGHFDAEIVPVTIPAKKKGEPPTIVKEDDEVTRGNPAKLPQLRPCFKTDGTGSVTAGNASPLSDGAAAVVLMSAAAAEKYGCKVLARIRSFADAAKKPEEFTTAPALAIPKAVEKAGLTLGEIDFFEINEAFSVVAVANTRLLGLDDGKVNVNGGAVAMGHPLGCSGARIIVTLLHVLRARGGSVGCAAVCNGGGGASALVIEVN